MIRFTLACERGDRFEAWFRNGADYDSQARAGRIACPACGTTTVDKALMAPAVPGGREQDDARVDLVVPDPRQAQLVEMMQRISRQVRANSDNVGDRFAEEARRIHFGEAAPRGIYGQASLDEARSLMEDGVGFSPLPALPEDCN